MRPRTQQSFTITPDELQVAVQTAVDNAVADFKTVHDKRLSRIEKTSNLMRRVVWAMLVAGVLIALATVVVWFASQDTKTAVTDLSSFELESRERREGFQESDLERDCLQLERLGLEHPTCG